ncbi:MAG: SGNH/GDSL hydrolase family protein [Anaerolineales bacterium]|nr:SGNH/GDSL hydrolase family protein [Anaerolineales bacterium]
MRSHDRRAHLFPTILVLGLLVISGCQNATPEQPLTDIARPTSEPAQTGSAADTETPPGSPATAVDEPAMPQATAQPAATAEIVEIDWREVPIMPEEISPRVIEIYQDGQAQGRDPHHFSVIGDCQAIPFVFMGPFERGELAPDSAEGYLWDAIDNFEGSFLRQGMAVRGGFTAASILNPLQADPHYCIAGETPLTCEYRLHNPAFVIITLETWLDPETIDRYDFYLRQILDYVIERGSVPILLTKADASELRSGEHVINPTIIRVARDYDVPVVNFWRSAQYLDNRGIDSTREGFHLSQDGYNLKNILTLRALYMVWSVIEGREVSTNHDPGAPTPEPAQAAATSPTELEITTPDCAGGCIFFGTSISHDGLVTPNGVLAYNALSGELTRILGEGFDLQDVSADGQRLLVNDSDHLYQIDLTDGATSLISDSFFSFGQQDAYWSADDSQVVYLDQDRPIQTETGQAFTLFPSGRDGEIYFESGSCAGRAICQSGGVYLLDPDQALTRLDSYSRLVFSPDGNRMAFLNPAAATPENYHHIRYLLLEDVNQGGGSRRVFYFPDVRGFMIYPDVREYAFSPDSDRLFILYDVYSAYYERSLRLQTYVLDIPSGILYEFGRIDGPGGSLNPGVIWAPEGDRVLIFLTDVMDGTYTMNIYQTNLETGDRLTLVHEALLTSNDYFYITNIFWP